MPHTINWVLNNRIIYIRYQGLIILDDVQESSKCIADKLFDGYKSKSENRIIGIIDICEANLESIFGLGISIATKQLTEVMDPRIFKAKPGFCVLITNSEIAKTVVSIIIKVASQPMTTVATLAEAKNNIIAMYPELKEYLNDQDWDVL